ncbi:hypothetical protein CEV08_07445 [Bartonella tribocorum]|uniref:Uncharacterized protein n=2 Tax=Bartonella tribocorum TaxID=85701 RepID=A0A2M6URF5_9HYPH|nr:hypothetical protein CEV08_07445 [Bartonella tribocorum]
MKYFFSICALLLIFLNVAKASEHTVFQRETSLGSLPTVFSSDLFLSKKSNFLLNKVIIPAHPGDTGLFYKTVSFLFEGIKRIYQSLINSYYRK